MQKPLIAVLLASALFTLDAQAADLIQVYQQALANDATYASARAALAAGEESVTQGRAGLLPSIGMTGSVMRRRTSRWTAAGRRTPPGARGGRRCGSRPARPAGCSGRRRACRSACRESAN